jgi:DNA-binding GntR family transcriptional regulator
MSVKRGTPLYEQIYEQLWKLVLTGKVLPGQRLGDREWAEKLTTSRTPVREAMRQMAQDGVLVTLESGGYQVRSVDAQGLVDLYRCRAPLAAVAAHNVAQNGSDRVLRQLRTAIDATKKAISQRNASAVFKSNSEFHNLIVENSGNPYLILTMARLDRLIVFYRTALLEASIRDASHSDAYFQHLSESAKRQEMIAKAIEDRSASEASRLMERHLLQSAEEMTQLLKVPAAVS